MTIEEIKWLVEALAKYSVGALIAAGIFFLLVKHYLGGYLPEKGKNLAAKEDIAKITDLVEAVKHDYNVLIEEMKGKQQLRMAALDKRLEVHQKAFSLWRKVKNASSNSMKIIPAFQECREWYYENCLYLEPEVRTAFFLAFSHALNVNVLHDTGGDREEIEKSWKAVTDFPDVLFKAVQLPCICGEELDKITSINAENSSSNGPKQNLG